MPDKILGFLDFITNATVVTVLISAGAGVISYIMHSEKGVVLLFRIVAVAVFSGVFIAPYVMFTVEHLLDMQTPKAIYDSTTAIISIFSWQLIERLKKFITNYKDGS